MGNQGENRGSSAAIAAESSAKKEIYTHIHIYVHKESKLIKAALKQWILSSHSIWRWVNNGTTEISFMQRSRVCWELSVWQFAADACLEEPFISVIHAHYYTLLPGQHDSTPASTEHTLVLDISGTEIALIWALAASAYWNDSYYPKCMRLQQERNRIYFLCW